MNERVEKVVHRFSAEAPIGFVCECAIQDCTTHIELARDEYEGIRLDATHFFVLPDHVFPEVETVVEDRGHYVIVEKTGVGGRLAAATDTRQRSTS